MFLNTLKNYELLCTKTIDDSKNHAIREAKVGFFYFFYFPSIIEFPYKTDKVFHTTLHYEYPPPIPKVYYTH